MAKTFQEWLKDFSPNGVAPSPIAYSYLEWYFLNLGKKFLEPIAPGYVSNTDVYNRAMKELANISKFRFKDSTMFVKTDVISEPIFSDLLETDEMNGECEDGSTDMVRFIRHFTPEQISRTPDNQDHPKIVRKKAGAFIQELIDNVCDGYVAPFPESVKIWICEMFKAKTFAKRAYKDYELHVTKEFWRIYDPHWCEGDFGSCMGHSEWNGNWTFYYNSCDCHAAYITKKDKPLIVARCIIFDDIRDEYGQRYRYAERQYSSNGKDSLKQILVDMLKAGGYIDCHKVVGASCHEHTRIVDSFSNASLSGKSFSTRCSLINGDNISYQDTFKSYSPREHRMYNYAPVGKKLVGLNTVAPWYNNENCFSSRPNCRNWGVDNFHRCYIGTEDFSTTRVIKCYSNTKSIVDNVVFACFDDTIKVNGEWWYKYDVIYDAVTGKHYPKYDMVYSKIEGAKIPKDAIVKLANGDVCYKQNAVDVNGLWYHKSSLIFVPCIKGFAIKELCTFIDNEPYPCADDAVRKVGKKIKVLTKQGTWRNIDATEWDGDGWYDKKSYVDAITPVWDKSSKKHILGTKRIRHEYAFKNNGKWYDNATCHYDMLTKEVHIKMPHKKFPFVDIRGNGETEMFICISDEQWRQFESISNLMLT